MKHIKLYEQFLNEIKIGKTLFSKTTQSRKKEKENYYKDKTGDEQYDWEQGKYLYADDNEYFIQRLKDSMKNNADELNTPEEQRFLRFIYNWVEYGKDQKTFPPSLYKDLKSLLKIKPKFILILEPLASTYITDNVWRGATITLDKAKEIIANGKLTPSVRATSWNIDSTRYKIKTKVTSRAFKVKKYVSFTSSFKVAARFYKFSVADNLKKDPETARVPCILEIPTANKNLLFNPNFLSLFSDYSEHETFYIGDGGIDITGIYFDPSIIKDKHETR